MRLSVVPGAPGIHVVFPDVTNPATFRDKLSGTMQLDAEALKYFADSKYNRTFS
ncbi:hypothetical protein [Dyadobacter sp. LHD-138]|uniref:hypothetical protein n=1 Tax=Dyadobacter sp. LHD-138 TaxID=3071413 RepID=UPI0027E13342|nr:hypothetical protein [Dyadobacter sp. LHD-138]MDQ6479392.1 hypothetical protein [Dyadobacter sp. LHD-138]